MKEWLMIGVMATGGIGFAIGGTGFRFVRFAIMPLLLGALCYYAGIAWWRDLAFACTAGGILTLGYGDKVPMWRKCLVFAGYGLMTVWLGLTAWQVMILLAVITLYLLSNWKVTASTFVWKICEFLFGTYIGCAIANIISNHK